MAKEYCPKDGKLMEEDPFDSNLEEREICWVCECGKRVYRTVGIVSCQEAEPKLVRFSGGFRYLGRDFSPETNPKKIREFQIARHQILPP